jgi:uncharacterized protein (TIGR00255 family)
MPRSMTGYGRSEIQADGWTQSWEIRSVNHRHLDIRWRLPVNVRALESSLEQLMRSHAERGRVEINLNLSLHRRDLVGQSLNAPLAEALLDQLRNLAERRGDGFVPDYMRIMSMPHLWEETGGEPDPEMAESLEKGLAEAAANWNRAREREGRALEKDISMRLIRLEGWLQGLKDRTPEVKREKAEALETRIRSVIQDQSLDLDESRLVQEIAYLSDRLDVSEELVRLEAHLEQLGSVLEQEGGIGKRLDFILQECFREINTCGNKVQDSQVSRITVDFKAELEKCREQVQNIE